MDSLHSFLNHRSLPPPDTPFDGDDDNSKCRLLGPFALLVQLGLGSLALLSLVYKRWRERPQRPVKIWFFDVSKQVFGSVLVHIANVFMSMLTSGRFNVSLDLMAVPHDAPPPPPTGHFAARLLTRAVEDYPPNPCSFYLLNLAIDTTIGIPILIFLLHLITYHISLTPAGNPPESIQSGYYGDPPRALWWLKQSILYFCGLFGMKLCVLVVFLVFPWISNVGDWALRWTEGNEELQIIFVMMLFPLIMNALQYYIIDSFIKRRDDDDAAAGHETTTHNGGVYGRLPDSAAINLTPEEAIEDRRRVKSHAALDVRMLARRDSAGSEDTSDSDPDTPTTVLASSSRRPNHGTTVPPELFPSG